jgi:phospholipid N-methyltransferase
LAGLTGSFQKYNFANMSAHKWLFVKNFIKHPVTVSSIIPSSRFLMNRILNRVDWERARTIIEFGPGVGNFTQEILKRMRPDARLGAIELNGDFVEWLRTSIPDPRLHVAHQSVEGVEDVMRQMGVKHVDYVISGIPFSVLPEPVREKVVQATHSVLSPDGSFMVYQFSRAVLPSLERVFRKVEQEFEPLNVLPARLFYCAK